MTAHLETLPLDERPAGQAFASSTGYIPNAVEPSQSAGLPGCLLGSSKADGRGAADGTLKKRQHNNVFRESASAIAAILDLHFPTGTILDANFGLGAFYKKTDRKVTGVDLRPPAEVICDNRFLPFGDDSFDVGVCDPPYKRGDGRKYEHRYGVAPKTETQVTWSYHATLKSLLRCVRQGVIIKVQDGTDGHRFHARHIEIADWMREQTGLEPHDICVIARPKVAPTMAQGTPHFFQQGVSYFLIYRWREKWKPLRF